jgi:hypothetical protein
MADYLCQACNRKMDGNQAYDCPKCQKILCDNCKGSASQCKDSPKGTAGCDGYFKRRE